MTKLNDKTTQLLNIIEMSFIFSKYSKDSKKIIDQSIEWDIFEPTKFMYLYQTFNMIYDCSWDLFRKDRSNNRYGFYKNQNGNNNTTNYKNDNTGNRNENDFSEENYGKYFDENIKVYEKIFCFNKFCQKISGSPFLHQRFKNLLFAEENRILIKEFAESMDEIKLTENAIRGGRAIHNQNCLKAIKESPLEEKWDDYNSGKFLTNHILNYLDYLRNNLFHGSKKIKSLLSKSQIKRFEYYNKLLEIYIELFFSLMKEKYEYDRVNFSELKLILNQ